MRYILFCILASLLLGSCTINKDLLFRTPKDYQYATLPEALGPSAKLSANNFVTMNFLTGNGYMLVEMGIGSGMLGGQGGGGGQQQGGGQQGMMMMMQGGGMRYLIDRDGTAKLPVIGRVELAGLTIREAETLLEERYSQYYNEPYVMLNVLNNRVIVSPGAGGTAAVITLMNNNTTLLEALAMVGGVNDRGNASQVKLIRQNDETKEREVYKIDLSRIDGIHKADMIVQPNDIIYVEPLPLIARELVMEITPILTLVSTTILLLAILNIN